MLAYTTGKESVAILSYVLLIKGVLFSQNKFIKHSSHNTTLSKFYISHCITIFGYVSGDAIEGKAKANLCDILQFITGVRNIPPLEFDRKVTLQSTSEQKYFKDLHNLVSLFFDVYQYEFLAFTNIRY